MPQNDLSKWSGNYQVLNCPGDGAVKQILGGNNPGFITIIEDIIIQRPFYQINVHFSFYRVGDWFDESLLVYVNQNLISNHKFYDILDVCQGVDIYSKDSQDEIYFRLNQSLIPINITIATNFVPSSNKFWGIRNFILEKVSCNETCKSCNGSLDFQCLTCYYHADLIDGKCVCQDGYFMQISSNQSTYPSSSCVRCDKLCLTCFDYGDNKCLTCPPGSILFNNTCKFSSKFY